MPWTSNLAEQALRHAKIHLKISGCFRSLITTRAYCRIHSHPITIRLNAVPPMQAIRDALAGHPWTPPDALTTAWPRSWLPSVSLYLVRIFTRVVSELVTRALDGDWPMRPILGEGQCPRPVENRG